MMMMMMMMMMIANGRPVCKSRRNWRRKPGKVFGTTVWEKQSHVELLHRQASEDEKRRLERRVTEQMEVLKKKQQEYSRLKAGHWHENRAILLIFYVD